MPSGLVKDELDRYFKEKEGPERAIDASLPWWKVCHYPWFQKFFLNLIHTRIMDPWHSPWLRTCPETILQFLLHPSLWSDSSPPLVIYALMSETLLRLRPLHNLCVQSTGSVKVCLVKYKIIIWYASSLLFRNHVYIVHTIVYMVHTIYHIMYLNGRTCIIWLEL